MLNDEQRERADGRVSRPAVPRWEHFPHGADIGVRGVGRSLEEAFVQGGLALTAVVASPEAIQQMTGVRIECEAAEPDVLFVDWLNAIVYEMAVRRMLFGAYRVTIDGSRLTAEAIGEQVEESRHEPAVEIKGATYTGLRVAREPDDSWTAQCVVDV